MNNSSLVRSLAQTFLAGEQTVDGILMRVSQLFGREWRWPRPLALRYIDAFAGVTRPRYRDVARFLKTDRGVRRAMSKYRRKLQVQTLLTEPHRMQPVDAAKDWNLPRIESLGELCDWLWLDPTDLDWFGDLKHLNGRTDNSRLGHYHYRPLTRPDGSIRLIEAPKRRLKSLQRQILTEILDRIPPHRCAHGFVKGRSTKTFAAPHVGKRVALRMDLRDFFPNLRAARIQTMFRTMGYPEPVADVLGGLSTNAVPHIFWRHLDPGVGPEARDLYARPHLPQGAPVSPSLANMCCFRLDCRLAGLADAAGAAYTRYADDLAFSGDQDFERCVDRFAIHVAAILYEEGFAVNHRKTRIMRRGVRQHLAGLVVNERMNIDRRDVDLLKATLTNCVRLGPSSQNRGGLPDFRAHLRGRVAYVESVNAPRGKKLRELLERIVW
jgi:RNA-directed DNA polymerase